MLVATQYAGFAAGGQYRANAVNFDGSNDYARRLADLTGNGNGKSGLFAASLKLNGGDGTQMRLWSTAVDGIVVLREPSNKIRVLGDNAGLQLNMTSVGTYTSSSGWVDIIAAWDLANTTGWLYINDVDDLAGSPTFNNVALDYTQTDHVIGAKHGTFVEKLNGDIADLYLNLAAFLDLSVEANRRKFFDPNGKPVDLGDDGSFATLSQPIAYFSRRGADTPDGFATNKGSGGGFTVTGALTAATTSPSD